MLVKILGSFDIFISVILFLMAIHLEMPFILLLIIIIFLVLKSLPSLFSLCVASFIDLITALILIISLFFNIPVLLLVLAALAIGQKGVFSML